MACSSPSGHPTSCRKGVAAWCVRTCSCGVRKRQDSNLKQASCPSTSVAVFAAWVCSALTPAPATLPACCKTGSAAAASIAGGVVTSTFLSSRLVRPLGRCSRSRGTGCDGKPKGSALTYRLHAVNQYSRGMRGQANLLGPAFAPGSHCAIRYFQQHTTPNDMAYGSNQNCTRH
eukprot:GHUV01028530.1.p1 GENE.GHUV01028530.1~~GHUV01028530.1.p1  ORF type:complete len:174 (+),score=27.08 GHUV01028530.1:333-854(+)